jgi:zinc-ribbon domain
MVYSPSKVVACVKCDGKILREDGQTVTLPFGSEYSVLIKNLNSVRIKFKVSVDGTDATENVWLVVDPNSSFDLERYIRNGNLESGNRFKFIERTESVEQHRGIKADDGLIRIEYQVEKKREVVDEIIHHRRRHIYDDDYPTWPRPWRFGGDDIMRASSATKGSPIRAMGMKTSGPMGASASSAPSDWVETSALGEDLGDQILGASCGPVPTSDKGITVPGSESSQSFRWTSGFETGSSEVIVLQLRGKVGGKKAVKAVTVDVKPKCTTCGRTNKATSKFCANCGTALEII